MKNKLNNSQNFMLTSVGSTPKDSYSKPSTFFNTIPKILNNLYIYDEKVKKNYIYITSSP